MSKYLRVDEEALLIALGFEIGMSGTTWWSTDNDGETWCAAIEDGVTNLRWSKLTESGAMGGYELMERSEFYNLFAERVECESRV